MAAKASFQPVGCSLPSCLVIGTSRRRRFSPSQEKRALSEIHSSFTSSCSRGRMRITSLPRASTRMLLPTASSTSIDSVLRSSQVRARYS